MLKFKKFLILLLSLMFFTGCATQQKEQIARYTEKNVKAGLYVFREGYYYSLYTFDGASPEADVQWVENGLTYLIPHIYPGDELVLFTNDVVPTEINLYSLIDFGSTVGVRFEQYLDTDKFTIPSNEGYDKYCPTSVQLEYFKQTLPSLNNIRIEEIADESQVYPFTKQLVNSKGLLKGLTADALYALNFYQGTEFHEARIKADTRAFILDKSYTLKNYVELRSKHFNIKLPKNMSAGFWEISAGDFSGCFYLEPDVELFGEDMIEKEAESEIENQEPTQEDLLEEIDVEQLESAANEEANSETPEVTENIEADAPAEETSENTENSESGE